uniref:Hydroxylamine reductase n=1 Tax=Desulfovibrio sp. U5L TaxID=596152 RepID=I2PYY0_9BACT
MFCYQCEQTMKGEGCTKIGVCGKQPEVSDLQDLTAYVLRGLALVAREARRTGHRSEAADASFPDALFSTLTNVNFDPDDFVRLIHDIVRFRDELRQRVEAAGHPLDLPEGPATFVPASDYDGLLAQARKTGLFDYPTDDPDIRSLMHTVLFGLKGVSAYMDHAQVLGKKDQEISDFYHDALSAGWDGQPMTLEDWVGLALKTGEINLKTMKLLDAANTETYGDPVPTEVPLGHRKGKAIVVSGHDLKDLHMLLEQTKDKGITVYTHGEMIPCHGYPELKKYPHLYGNYGTAWQNQQKEFAALSGAVLMTTNCLQRILPAYTGNVFTTGRVGWPGAPHIAAKPDGTKDFTPVIERALALPGFAADEEGGSAMVGFGHKTLLGVAGKVVELVKAGKIRHFFLVGGCDGAKPGRNYYTKFVEQAPRDTVILTLACGKYRFNALQKALGDIDGIPRLLDVGQCNDTYSAIVIASALAEAFQTDVNSLPLSLIISWYEQKAAAILLTLLFLGIKNIYLGPSLPAFLTPNVLNFLVGKYNIKPIGTPEEDLKAILG